MLIVLDAGLECDPEPLGLLATEKIRHPFRVMAIRFADQTIELQELPVPVHGYWRGPTNSWALFLVVEGSGFVQDNGNSYPVGVGDVVVVPDCVGVHFQPHGTPNLGLRSVHFAIESVGWGASLGARLAFRQAVGLWKGARIVPKDAALSVGMEGLVKEIGASSPTSLRDPSVVQKFNPVFDELKEILMKGAPSVGETTTRILNVLCSVGNGNLHDMSVAEMAKRCGCSRRHLSRLVREHFGSALVSVRTELRLDRAADLLRSADRKIIDVAMDCGFTHLGLFTTKFRERFGMTPGQWRKQVVLNKQVVIPDSLPREVVRTRTQRR